MSNYPNSTSVIFSKYFNTAKMSIYTHCVPFLLPNFSMVYLINVWKKKSFQIQSLVHVLWLKQCNEQQINISGNSIQNTILSCVYSYKHRIPEMWLKKWNKTNIINPSLTGIHASVGILVHNFLNIFYILTYLNYWQKIHTHKDILSLIFFLYIMYGKCTAIIY